MLVNINKVTIKREVNGELYDIYPRTTVDMIMYDKKKTVYDKIKIIEKQLIDVKKHLEDINKEE